jgi:hypothetical protein
MLWLNAPIEFVSNWKTKRALTPFPGQRMTLVVQAKAYVG